MTYDLWESYFMTLRSILELSGPVMVDVESYERLLWHLHNTEFVATLYMDENRVADALSFRRILGYSELPQPVSVLELMVSLSRRLETDVMQGTSNGDRTATWFWGMVESLGLIGMTNDVYDAEYVDYVVSRFISRRYSANGRGGLFTVPSSPVDMREKELWYQASLFLNGVLKEEGFIEP